MKIVRCLNCHYEKEVEDNTIIICPVCQEIMAEVKKNA